MLELTCQFLHGRFRCAFNRVVQKEGVSSPRIVFGNLERQSGTFIPKHHHFSLAGGQSTGGAALLSRVRFHASRRMEDTNNSSVVPFVGVVIVSSSITAVVIVLRQSLQGGHCLELTCEPRRGQGLLGLADAQEISFRSGACLGKCSVFFVFVIFFVVVAVVCNCWRWGRCCRRFARSSFMSWDCRRTTIGCKVLLEEVHYIFPDGPASCQPSAPDPGNSDPSICWEALDLIITELCGCPKTRIASDDLGTVEGRNDFRCPGL
mmetsp:Transcript_95644/g.199924  ORF Transcript_95644/g.199924 Transcript_95644/m.199924 type:complete len:263 (+) Transcript_95644:75-863(+)